MDMPVLGTFFSEEQDRFDMQLLGKLAKTYYVEGNWWARAKKRVLRQDGGI